MHRPSKPLVSSLFNKWYCFCFTRCSISQLYLHINIMETVTSLSSVFLYPFIFHLCLLIVIFAKVPVHIWLFHIRIDPNKVMESTNISFSRWLNVCPIRTRYMFGLKRCKHISLLNLIHYLTMCLQVDIKWLYGCDSDSSYNEQMQPRKPMYCANTAMCNVYISLGWMSTAHLLVFKKNFWAFSDHRRIRRKVL